MGVSGEALRESLLILKPEIYGSIAEDKVELDGLLYIMDRLPVGIEECTYINLTSDEGYANSHFEPIIPAKRRRRCYRIDKDQMNIEITRGRSEIYDILTHLTFLMIESHKIIKNVLIGENGSTTRDWKYLDDAISKKKLSQQEKEVAIAHVANILGRTYQEVIEVYERFATQEQPNRFLHVIFHMGELAKREILDEEKRVVTFSSVLRERLGHHIHGERWATKIKKTLEEDGLIDRPLHIISANMHSVMNSIYAETALPTIQRKKDRLDTFAELSNSSAEKKRETVRKYALRNGMIEIKDSSGTNIDVQVFDTSQDHFLDLDYVGARFSAESRKSSLSLSKTESEKENKPVLLVMDYAFGEQAYEVMDELLKPHIDKEQKEVQLKVASVNIMGKAGILEGNKGDIMLPNAHVFEGTADNYPLDNKLKKRHFETSGLNVVKGSMITVLGTSLQNKDLLEYFYNSSWKVIGLEMEGAHYQKAIQSASRVRKSISKNVEVRYAYYASDNPLKTGHTLASGGLGLTGVKPVYFITEHILKQIYESDMNHGASDS